MGEIRFADPTDGWVFAPDIWSTHDGGTSWKRVTLGGAPSQVVALEAAAGEVDAVVTHCQGEQTDCPAQLWHSPTGSDQFSEVGAVKLPPGVAASFAISLHGHTGYLVDTANSPASPDLWVTTDGLDWVQRASPCGADMWLVSVGPFDATHAYMLCTAPGAAGSAPKRVYLTPDAGRSFTALAAQPPTGGDGGVIAAASSSVIAIASSSGGSAIYLSSDTGRSWTSPRFFGDGGVGFGYFGFTDATHGLALHAPAARTTAPGAKLSDYGPDPASLLLTNDAGRTWTPLQF